MNIVELYAQTPVERHHEIVVDAQSHVFFDRQEWVMDDARNLTLIHKNLIESNPPQGVGAAVITNIHRDVNGKTLTTFKTEA